MSSRYLIGAIALGQAGLDANRVVAAVSSMKPMDVAHARRLIALAIAALKYANASAPTSHWYAPSTWALPDATNAIAKREDMIKKFGAIEATVVDAASRGVTVLPESAASILRDHAIQAIWEFNSVAEGNETFSATKDKFYADLEDNAKDLAKKGIAAGKAVVDAAGKVAHEVAWYGKVTFWAALGVGVGAASLIGYGVYKRARGPS
jgi:hypothetical protein